jgi:hypothetical protein
MTRIKLTAAQIDRLTPIKTAGGYNSISAVIWSMIAIYGDAMLDRVSNVPNGVPTNPNDAPTSPNSVLTSVPTMAPTSPNSAASNPTATPPAPKRTKFDL